MHSFSPNAFKLARKQKGISQRALGELIGTTEQHVQLWEYGKALPTANYLLRAMVALDVSAAQLLTTEEA